MYEMLREMLDAKLLCLRAQVSPVAAYFFSVALLSFFLFVWQKVLKHEQQRIELDRLANKGCNNFLFLFGNGFAVHYTIMNVNCEIPT